MPKILITGNGFDLHFGLPTLYSDFIKIISSIKDDKIEFNNIYSKSKNSKTLLKNFTPFQFDANKIQELESLIRSNLWFIFFRKEYEIETWIDFENKIEFVIKTLFSSIQNLNKGVFNNGSINHDHNLVYDHAIFANNIETINILTTFRILTTYDSCDIELNKEYLVSKNNYYINLDLNRITKNLSEELDQFKKIFNLYFEIFVLPLLYTTKLFSFDKSLFNEIDNHYSFNYTPTFETIFERTDITTQFLHGRINSNTNQIVLGINEIPETDLNKKYFIPFTKYFQKLNYNTDYKFLKEYEEENNHNYIFYFWGHSLDSSDSDYINEVFNFVLKLNSEIKKIIILYHSLESRSNMLINLLNIRGKNDIDFLMRSDILTFTEINSLKLSEELKRNIAAPYLEPSFSFH